MADGPGEDRLALGQRIAAESFVVDEQSQGPEDRRTDVGQASLPADRQRRTRCRQCFRCATLERQDAGLLEETLRFEIARPQLPCKIETSLSLIGRLVAAA